MSKWLLRWVRHKRWETRHKVTGYSGRMLILDHRWEVSLENVELA